MQRSVVILGFVLANTCRAQTPVVGSARTDNGTTIGISKDVMITTTLRSYCFSGGSGSLDNSNTFGSDPNRDTQFNGGWANGSSNRLMSWNGQAGGTANWVDGKISAAFGNTNIATGNDSFVGGNLNAVGRRAYPVVGQGVDDPGLGVGNKAYVVIKDTEGDVSGYFPWPGQSAAYVTATYGAGAANVGGNIYASGYSSPADLTWAMHPYMMVRGSIAETAITMVKILRAVYSSGSGTKVWYDSATSAYPTITLAYSAYSPVVAINGVIAGTGMIAMGVYTSAWGMGSHAEGYQTRAWGPGAHAQGYLSQALGQYSSANGIGMQVTGSGSFGIGLIDQTGAPLTQASTFSVMGGMAGFGTVTPGAVLETLGKAGQTPFRINTIADIPSYIQYSINGSNGWTHGMASLGAGSYKYQFYYGPFGGGTPALSLGTDNTLAVGSGGSANKAVCWKSDGKTLGYCSTQPDANGACTCN
jgi:hypothetical protein